MSEEMSNTKKNRASVKAIAEYNKNNYDRLAVVVPKGGAEQIKAAAASENKSTNRYILEALEAKSGLRLAMDSARSFAAASRGYAHNPAPNGAGARQGSSEGYLTPAALNAAQHAADAESEDVSAFIERAIVTQADRDAKKRQVMTPSTHKNPAGAMDAAPSALDAEESR